MSSGKLAGAIRPTVLVLTPSYLPASSGPSRSIQALIDHLSVSHNFQVVTSAKSLDKSSSMTGGADKRYGREDSVVYLKESFHSVFRLSHLLRKSAYDLIYLNTLFHPLFGVLPLVLRAFGMLPARPCVIAPRGQLLPSALAVKGRRKRAILPQLKRLVSQKAITWHASNPDEAAVIDGWLESATIMTARNLVPKDLYVNGIDGATRISSKKAGVARFIYLGRIAENKGLDRAITALRAFKQQVTLDIYGRIDNAGYWSVCRMLIERFGLTSQVSYLGVLSHAQVFRTLGEYDAMVLPTRGESFGHVIAEALAAGCPVITTEATPWRDLEICGAGWLVDGGDEHALRRAMEAVRCLDESEHCVIRERAKAYVTNKLNSPENVAHNVALFDRC